MKNNPFVSREHVICNSTYVQLNINIDVASDLLAEVPDTLGLSHAQKFQ